MADEAVLKIVVKDEGGDNLNDPQNQGPPITPQTPAASIPSPSPRPANPPATSQQTSSSSSQRFDARAEAERMREGEIRREQIKDIYNRLYGSASEAEGAFDAVLGLAKKMRGTLGGVFGTFVGSILDVISAVHDARPERKSSARIEAERRNYVSSLSSVAPVPPASGRLTGVPPAAQQESRPFSAVSSAAPQAAAAPGASQQLPQAKEIIAEASDALVALGHSQAEADRLLQAVMQTATKTFAKVQEVIVAVYARTALSSPPIPTSTAYMLQRGASITPQVPNLARGGIAHAAGGMVPVQADAGEMVVKASEAAKPQNAAAIAAWNAEGTNAASVKQASKAAAADVGYHYGPRTDMSGGGEILQRYGEPRRDNEPIQVAQGTAIANTGAVAKHREELGAMNAGRNYAKEAALREWQREEEARKTLLRPMLPLGEIAADLLRQQSAKHREHIDRFALGGFACHADEGMLGAGMFTNLKENESRRNTLVGKSKKPFRYEGNFPNEIPPDVMVERFLQAHAKGKDFEDFYKVYREERSAALPGKESEQDLFDRIYSSQSHSADDWRVLDASVDIFHRHNYLQEQHAKKQDTRRSLYRDILGGNRATDARSYMDKIVPLGREGQRALHLEAVLHGWAPNTPKLGMYYRGLKEPGYAPADRHVIGTAVGESQLTEGHEDTLLGITPDERSAMEQALVQGGKILDKNPQQVQAAIFGSRERGRSAPTIEGSRKQLRRLAADPHFAEGTVPRIAMPTPEEMIAATPTGVHPVSPFDLDMDAGWHGEAATPTSRGPRMPGSFGESLSSVPQAGDVLGNMPGGIAELLAASRRRPILLKKPAVLPMGAFSASELQNRTRPGSELHADRGLADPQMEDLIRKLYGKNAGHSRRTFGVEGSPHVILSAFYDALHGDFGGGPAYPREMHKKGIDVSSAYLEKPGQSQMESLAMPRILRGGHAFFSPVTTIPQSDLDLLDPLAGNAHILGMLNKEQPHIIKAAIARARAEGRSETNIFSTGIHTHDAESEGFARSLRGTKSYSDLLRLPIKVRGNFINQAIKSKEQGEGLSLVDRRNLIDRAVDPEVLARTRDKTHPRGLHAFNISEIIAKGGTTKRDDSGHDVYPFASHGRWMHDLNRPVSLQESLLSLPNVDEIIPSHMPWEFSAGGENPKTLRDAVMGSDFNRSGKLAANWAKTAAPINLSMMPAAMQFGSEKDEIAKLFGITKADLARPSQASLRQMAAQAASLHAAGGMLGDPALAQWQGDWSHESELPDVFGREANPADKPYQPPSPREPSAEVVASIMTSADWQKKFGKIAKEVFGGGRRRKGEYVADVEGRQVRASLISSESLDQQLRTSRTYGSLSPAERQAHVMQAGDRIANIEFSQGGDFYNNPKEMQRGSITLGHKLKEFASRMMGEGFGVNFTPADEQRGRLYAKMMRGVGGERILSETSNLWGKPGLLKDTFARARTQAEIASMKADLQPDYHSTIQGQEQLSRFTGEALGEQEANRWQQRPYWEEQKHLDELRLMGYSQQQAQAKRNGERLAAQYAQAFQSTPRQQASSDAEYFQQQHDERERYEREGGPVNRFLQPPQMAHGGIVHAAYGKPAGQDDTLIAASGGEYVMPAAQTAKPENRDALDAMRTGAKSDDGWSLESTQKQVLAALGGTAGAPAARSPLSTLTGAAAGRLAGHFFGESAGNLVSAAVGSTYGSPETSAESNESRGPDRNFGRLMKNSYNAAKRYFGKGESIDTAAPLPKVTAAPEGSASGSVANVSRASGVAEAAPEAAAGLAEAGGALAAAAAGPAAIVVAVIEALQGVRDGAMSAVRGMGNFAAAAADPDASPAKMTANIGEATKGVSDKLFWVSPQLGIFGSIVGEATSSLGKFMAAADATATRYGEYSPQIAMAQAQAEIQQVMGDMRRANESGPQLAAYIKAQGDLQQKYEDIKIKILTKILPIVTDAVAVLEKLMPAAELIATPIGELLAPLKQVADATAWLARLGQDARAPQVQDPVSVLFGEKEGQASNSVPTI